jgi:transcriptional regulator with XRE-family HTH domain
MVISEAVKELRKAEGLSQQVFATKLNMGIASIGIYETGVRPPDAVAALKLYRLAQEHRRDDIADAFVECIYTELGGMAIPIQNEEERRKVRAVQLILSDPRFQYLQRALNKVLAPVEKHITESSAFVRLEAKQIPDVVRQMIKLQQEQAKGKR